MTTERTRTVADYEDIGGEVRAGRTFPFSQPGDWVALADIPAGPKALYLVYAGHINVKVHGHTRCWPMQETLANILRTTKKTIRTWNTYLEELGAITVTEVIDPSTGRKRLVVDVHQRAPEGYDGFVDYKSYYDSVKAMRDELTDSVADLAAKADASDARGPGVKMTPGPEVKITPGDDQGKHDPEVKITPGQGPEITPSQGSKGALEEEQFKESKQRTHTPAAAEAPAEAEPEPDSVCDTPQDNPAEPDVHDGHRQAAWNLLRAVVPKEAATRMTDNQRDDLVARVAVAIAKGWGSALLVPHLNATVNERTEYPYALLRKRLEEVTKEPPQSAAASPADPWGHSSAPGSTTEATGFAEAAPGVRLLPDGSQQILYSSCGARDCTGGSGAGRGIGTYRRRIDPDTGAANNYCDNAVTLRDKRITTCHPEARKGQKDT